MYRHWIGKYNLHGKSNDNSTRLINFTITRNMIVSNTIFPYKHIHKKTCVRNQIDHVLVEKRIKIWITDVWSMKESSVILDNFLTKVHVKIRLSVE